MSKQQLKKCWDSAVLQMGKLGEQRHMASLRDGFALLVPIIIAASIGIICMTFIFGWYDTTSTSILGWITWGIPGQVETTADGIVKFVQGSIAYQISYYGTFIFYTIWNAIFSFLSLFATITISYSLSKIKRVDNSFIASLVALAAFLILSYGDQSLFGTSGLLLAIISSIVSIELYSVFEKNEKLQLKMPNGVPPAVARSFSKLFPTMFTLLIMVAIQAPFLIINWIGSGGLPDTNFSIGKAIESGIQAPFLGISDSKEGSYAIGFIFVTFSTILWFFGLHGQNVLTGIFSPIFLVGLEKNAEYIKAGGINNTIGLTPTVLADGTQDAFIFFGGTGTTLALVLIGLLISKRKMEREILKFGSAPAIFNINEPILFGVPLILNFAYFIPFVFTQITLFTTTWLAIEVLKWVPPVIVKIPWTTPVAIGGFLATSSWQGILLALFNFAIATLIWWPFVWMGTLKAKKNGEELVQIDYKAGAKKITNFFIKNKKVSNEEVSNE